jgi:hypothetical protein
MPAYNDFNVPYGSQIVTIAGSPFIGEQFTFTDASTQIERMDQNGLPTGQVIIPGFSKGTGTLQLATTLSTVPTIGATFTFIRNGGATVGAVITDVGEVENQKDARKTTIGFRVRVAS